MISRTGWLTSGHPKHSWPFSPFNSPLSWPLRNRWVTSASPGEQSRTASSRLLFCSDLPPPSPLSRPTGWWRGAGGRIITSSTWVSPLWHFAREEDAKKSLLRLRGVEYDVEKELREIVDKKMRKEQAGKRSVIKSILSKEFLLPFVKIGILMSLSQWAGINILSSYLVTVFEVVLILFLYLDLILSYKRRAAQAWIPRWPRSWSPPSSWCSASSPPSSSGSASHSPNLNCPPEIEEQYILDEDSSLPVPGSLLESRSSSPAHPQFVLARLLLPPTIISPGSNLHFHFHSHFHFLFSLSLCSSHPQLFHQVPTSIRVDIQHSRCWRFLCACLPRSLSDSESQYGWVPVLAITLVQSARIIGFMSIIQLLIAESFQTNIRFLNILKLAFCWTSKPILGVQFLEVCTLLNWTKVWSLHSIKLLFFVFRSYASGICGAFTGLNQFVSTKVSF